MTSQWEQILWGLLPLHQLHRLGGFKTPGINQLVQLVQWESLPTPTAPTGHAQSAFSELLGCSDWHHLVFLGNP
jgi:hypothetical protein